MMKIGNRMFDVEQDCSIGGNSQQTPDLFLTGASGMI